jgi:hypothetical protein
LKGVKNGSNTSNDILFFVLKGNKTRHITVIQGHRLRTYEKLLSERFSEIRERKFYNEKKLHGLSPRENYTDRATAACRRSDCQLLRIEGTTWSAWRIPTAVFSVFYTGAATFLSSSSSVVLTRLSGPRSRPTTFFFW